MRFEEFPLEPAFGHILGHTVFARGKTLLAKRTRLGHAELARLHEAALGLGGFIKPEPSSA